MKNTVLFTQCYVRELDFIKKLYGSIATYEPNIDFKVILIDKYEHISASSSYSFEILPIENLKIAAFAQLAEKYNWKELKDNCKPFVIEKLLLEYQQVIYIAPTSVLHQSLSVLKEALAQHNAFLVPQLLNASKYRKENEALNYGIYHNGLMGFNRSDETSKFLVWWQNHTLMKGFSDPCHGMYMDRLCLELAPVFFKNTVVLKQQGLHIGSWNKGDRELDKEANTLITSNSPLKINYPKTIKPYWGKEAKEYSYNQQIIRRLLMNTISRIDNFFDMF